MDFIFQPGVLSAIGVLMSTAIVFFTKGKINEKTALIVWNFIEDIISNYKEKDLPPSEKQNAVVREIEKSKHLLPKKAQKFIDKETKLLGSVGAIVNLVYNQRKLIFKGLKTISKVF